MYVVKRNGRTEPVSFDKITTRIEKETYSLDPCVDATLVSQKVCAGVYKGVTTHELDELAAQTAYAMEVMHPDYSILAGRLVVSSLHRETHKTFSKVMRALYEREVNGVHAPAISDELWEIVTKYAHILDPAIVHSRDTFDYFGFKTLERSYLTRINDKIVERPQHMYMRVALGIHGHNIEAALETYDLISQHYFTHASPTLFNAGMRYPQLASCFLLSMGPEEDSIEGIYDVTLCRMAHISKYAGGIGVDVTGVRASGSYISGTGGKSDGLSPMLRVFNNTAVYVNQGGRRPGAIAAYLQPWHADVYDFLELPLLQGDEKRRARDLHYGLWIPDEFMRRVRNDEDWTLMCPSECPGLQDAYGAEFDDLYRRYEAEGKGRRVVKAAALYSRMNRVRIEAGKVYMMFKDHVNNKSAQKNLGTIRNSNLCTEIVEYTSSDEVAVCTLASVVLWKFVDGNNFDFANLESVVRVMVRNLNITIDRMSYPVEAAANSHKQHRPLGIGVQGLADVFLLMRIPYTSDEAKKLNREIFETMYYTALDESCVLAELNGPYSTFWDGPLGNSPASQGILQFDMWGVEPSDRYDWKSLKDRIKAHGLRNSLLIAPMPTASTASIIGSHESFEPLSSNLYVRRTLAGEFVMCNRKLVKWLVELDLWDHEMREAIQAHNGSVQNIDRIPKIVRDVFKTAYEISTKEQMDMAADRGAFIDQSQSFNVYMNDVSEKKFSLAMMYAWEKGLKTGCYYLRSKTATGAKKFTVSKSAVDAAANTAKSEPEEEGPTCTMQDGCISCGS